MSREIVEIKTKINNLLLYISKRFKNADTSDDPRYYQGYVAGYTQGIDDTLALFD